MYCVKDFPSKAALKRAVAAGESVRVYEPGPFPAKTDGRATIEGPHYPKPHTWYASVELRDGIITKVK